MTNPNEDENLSTLTYEQANPHVLLAVDETVLSDQIFATIYNADGSPAVLDRPTEDVINGTIKTMLDAVGPMELKTLIMSVSVLHRLAQGALVHTLNSLHEIAHDPNMAPQLSEELLCDGAHAYVTEASFKPAVIKEVTPENTADVLNQFFVGGRKPN